MGSIISKIDDDMDDYSYLCQKYNEKEKEIYSDHYYWLNELNDGKTKLSFNDYLYNKNKERVISRIKNIDEIVKSLYKEKTILKKLLKKQYNIK